MELLQGFEATNTMDDDGNPSGGTVDGVGIQIRWQSGPLGRGLDRIPPNGAFVADVLAAVIQRLEHYNQGKFRCRENSLAITHCEEAMHWLQARLDNRDSRGVEGTHEA